MNENQRDTEHRPDEGKQVQQELERQLREFGDTMSDAFRHGFEGRGRGDWRLCHGRDPGQRLGIHSHHRIVRLDDGGRCFPDACWQKAEPLRRHGRRV